MDIGWIIGLVLIVGFVGVTGGSIALYRFSRRQRQITLSRGETYHGPQSVFAPTGSPRLPPSSMPPPMIRWDNNKEHDDIAPSSFNQGRIRWGKSSEYRTLPPDIDLSNTDSWVKCPICQEILNVYESNIHLCQKCEAYFHQNCLAEYRQQCPNCGR